MQLNEKRLVQCMKYLQRDSYRVFISFQLAMVSLIMSENLNVIITNMVTDCEFNK
jgi:hypothetical protein